VTAEQTNATVSTAMMTTSSSFPTSGTPLAMSPPPICRAPSPSEAAEPKSVAKIARMSIALPNAPSVPPRLPSSGANAELISCRRPLWNVE